MSLDREQAWKQLCEWTQGDSLRKHALAVEAAMRAAAARYGGPTEDVGKWALAGLLHDADYEKWPEDHPKRIVAWLQEQGEPEIAHAISAHFTQWNVPHVTALDKALIACDELTGFIVACCLVRPDGIQSLTPQSVLKKLKQRSFAASVDRNEVTAGAEILGVDLESHIQFLLDSLKPQIAALGIGGR